MFSDESRFLLSGTDRRVRVWRRNLPHNLLQTVAYGGGSLMVWGGISLNNKTDLIFIRGNLTAERYVEEVVQNHILPFAHEIGPDFVLTQGGARAHTSRVTYIVCIFGFKGASTSKVIGARNEMMMDDYGGQMIFGDLVGLKLPDIRLTAEEKPRKKPHPGNLSRSGIEPGPAA